MRHGGGDAKRNKEVDGHDREARRDDGLGHVSLRAFHRVDEGCNYLAAHVVVDDDGKVRERCGVAKVWQHGLRRERRHEAVPTAVPDAHAANAQGEKNVDDGAEVHDPGDVANLLHGDPHHEPDKCKLDGNGHPHEKLVSQHAADGGGKQHGDGRKPREIAHPVVPRLARCPAPAQGVAHPLVHAGAFRVCGAKFRHDQAVRHQERDKQQQPPEHGRVADRRGGRARLDGEDDADYGEDYVLKTQLLSGHGDSVCYRHLQDKAGRPRV